MLGIVLCGGLVSGSCASTAHSDGPKTPPTAPQVERPEPHPAPAVKADDCGWRPDLAPGAGRVFFHHDLGCGTLEGQEAIGEVSKIRPASLEFLAKETLFQIVFVNEAGRRVLPIGRTVKYDMEFKHRERGQIVLTAAMHRDGVFTLVLPPNERGEPCETFLTLEFDNGSQVIESWIDDWEYDC